MSDAARQYLYTDEDRAAFDAAIQRVRSDEQTNALFEAMRLTMKHDLSGLQMTVAGYESFLREAAATLAKLAPIIGKIEVLEAQARQSAIDRDRIKDRLRAVEQDVAVLKAKTRPTLSDAPGD